jgi:hypothetical protein
VQTTQQLTPRKMNENLIVNEGIALPIAQPQSAKENQNNEFNNTNSIQERMKLLTSKNDNSDSTNERVKVERRNLIRFQTQVRIHLNASKYCRYCVNGR